MSEHHWIPRLGLGTFRLQDDAVIASVNSALELGYRHIDTATLYDNESAIGIALAQSGLARQEYFLTTKVWHDCLRPAALTDSVHQSLEQLQCDHLDLVLIHWPSPDNEVPIGETLGALNDLRNQGLTTHIGLSNFTMAQVDQALAAPGGEHLVNNQVEVHPFLQNNDLVAHCQARGLDVTAYMPLAVGNVMKDSLLREIGQAHNATPAQVAIAWLLQRGLVVIPSSTRREHQAANLEAADQVQLTTQEMQRISTLDRSERHANPAFAPAWDQT